MDFTEAQQSNIDSAWTAFKNAYSSLTDSDIIQVLATIEKMPLTTISDTEWASISNILMFRLPTVYPLLKDKKYSELTLQR